MKRPLKRPWEARTWHWFLKKCAAWARVCCSHIVALHCMQCHAGIPSIASCHFLQPFSQFGCLQGIILGTLCQLHCINSSSCQVLALHLPRLPASGIALFFFAHCWHYIFMPSHWVALQFHLLPLDGTAFPNLASLWQYICKWVCIHIWLSPCNATMFLFIWNTCEIVMACSLHTVQSI